MILKKLFPGYVQQPLRHDDKQTSEVENQHYLSNKKEILKLLNQIELLNLHLFIPNNKTAERTANNLRCFSGVKPTISMDCFNLENSYFSSKFPKV